MKIEGYVICQPINTFGDETKTPWWPKTWSFGRTPHEAWQRYLNIEPNHPDWDRMQQHYIDCGLCPKKATMDVEL